MAMHISSVEISQNCEGKLFGFLTFGVSTILFDILSNTFMTTHPYIYIYMIYVKICNIR